MDIEDILPEQIMGEDDPYLPEIDLNSFARKVLDGLVADEFEETCEAIAEQKGVDVELIEDFAESIFGDLADSYAKMKLLEAWGQR